MGALSEFEEAFGEDLGRPPQADRDRSNWQLLCCCGHLRRYHGPEVGGSFRFPTVAGLLYELPGCRGAMPLRNVEPTTDVIDTEARTHTVRYTVTCPCTEFRAVANVDRPNRYFNQRVNRDRHPFLTGVRALRTFLAGRKAAQTDPDWAAAEFDRRFTWLPDRVCSISKCRETEALPYFTNEELHSELRCAKHRP